MSTNNFKFENILITIPDFKFDNRCLEEECPHFEEEGNHCEHVDDYYEYDTEGYKMYVEEVQSQLEKIGFESCDSSDNDRSYPGQIIASLAYIDRNEDVLCNIEVVIRSGYYDGANIDYTIEQDDNIKMSKGVKNKIDNKIAKLEKILRKNGTELTRVGVFSNGEAVYKIKNR